MFSAAFALINVLQADLNGLVAQVSDSAEWKRLASVTQEVETPELSGRIDIWLEYWGAITLRPLFGHGAGSLGSAEVTVGIRSYPHNLFLDVLFENGFIGLVLFCGVLLASVRPVGGSRMFWSARSVVFIAALLPAMALATITFKFFYMTLLFVRLGDQTKGLAR